MNLPALFPKSKGCSQCCEGQLLMKDFRQADAPDETGERSPESRAYYECDTCAFRVKEFINGRIELPDDEEWNQFCE